MVGVQDEQLLPWGPCSPVLAAVQHTVGKPSTKRELMHVIFAIITLVAGPAGLTNLC